MIQNVFEAKKRVAEERDYVAIKRFDFSLEKLVKRYPDGAPIHVIAEALMISEPEVEELYQKAVVKLRHIMGVEVERACDCDQNDPHCVTCYGF
jgi:hypothetical protein